MSPSIFRTKEQQLPFPSQISPKKQQQKTQRQRNNISNLSDQKPQGESFLHKIFQFVSNFNLCLRPEVQSRQLLSFLQHYQVESLYQDPYYGQCYALKSKQIDQAKYRLNNSHSIFNTTQQKQHYNKIASLRHYVAFTKQRLYRKQYKQRKQVLQQINKYSGSQQNVLRFNIICELEKQQFIFTIMELYIAYDFILIDLEKQFENRIMQKRNFTEAQINIIMKDSCAGLVALENTNYKSIRMAHIYFCQYGKQIKVAHPKMFKYQSNLSTIAKNSDQKGIYLAPQQLDLLQKNQIPSQPQANNKNQSPNSFTFGMIILSLMCNKYLNQIYDYRTCQINYKQIQQILNNLTKKYSQRLINIVSKLLRIRIQQRLSLRSLLNILQEKYQLTEHVEITLIKENVNNQINQMYSGYRPLFEEEPEEPRHKNYLYGMVYPKIGTQGEYYHFHQSDPFKNNQQINKFQKDNSVIANHRFSYIGRQMNSKYMGGSISRNQLDQKPLKQGKGIFMLPDGQSYIGDWKNDQMHGHGKLYWPDKRIRYEGQFQNGQFHGFGTEYSLLQIPQREAQIDKTFVRVHKGSWLKYEGRFKHDKRQGPGKVYFKNGKWSGNFKDGQPNGYGLWQGSDGQKLKGVWKDGYYQHSS